MEKEARETVVMNECCNAGDASLAVLDEFKVPAKGSLLSDPVDSIAGGDREAASAEGGRSEALKWLTALLASGETTLEEMMKELKR